MIIGDKREQVIENIQQAVERGAFDSRVEVDDPALSPEGRKEVLQAYLKRRSSRLYPVHNWIARQIAGGVSWQVNRTTDIVGMENALDLEGGAILTANHFNPLDNTVLRAFARRLGKRKVYFVSNETNLVMPGVIGYLMNYADTLPISMERTYLQGYFEPVLSGIISQGGFVTIYPEQEMWFNYRKPRPNKKGAYHYAAKLGVPVLPCFIAIADLPEEDEKGFSKVRYTLHVLKPIYPDPGRSVRENELEMCRRDYRQKKAAYERAYGRALDYRFEYSDIAGWISPDERERQLDRCAVQ